MFARVDPALSQLKHVRTPLQEQAAAACAAVADVHVSAIITLPVTKQPKSGPVRFVFGGRENSIEKKKKKKKKKLVCCLCWGKTQFAAHTPFFFSTLFPASSRPVFQYLYTQAHSYISNTHIFPAEAQGSCSLHGEDASHHTSHNITHHTSHITHHINHITHTHITPCHLQLTQLCCSVPASLLAEETELVGALRQAVIPKLNKHCVDWEAEAAHQASHTHTPSSIRGTKHSPQHGIQQLAEIAVHGRRGEPSGPWPVVRQPLPQGQSLRGHHHGDCHRWGGQQTARHTHRRVGCVVRRWVSQGCRQHNDDDNDNDNKNIILVRSSGWWW